VRIQVHLDWLCFSYDGCPKWLIQQGDHLTGVLGKSGFGSRFYRHSMRWDDVGLVIQWGPRIKSNRDVQVEFSGKFFSSPEREAWAWEMCQVMKGHPSRIDVAWDFFFTSALELRHRQEFQAIRPVFGTRRDMLVNGAWSGMTIGYGPGSEACLRVYDKALEQGAQAPESMRPGDLEWWRIEFMLRGNTLKEQGLQRYGLEEVYSCFRSGMLSRYRLNPDGGRVGLCKARKKGLANSRNAVVFWQRKAAKAGRKLSALNAALAPEPLPSERGVPW